MIEWNDNDKLTSRFGGLFSYEDTYVEFVTHFVIFNTHTLHA